MSNDSPALLAKPGTPEMRSLFSIAPDVTPTNNGSFGTVPKSVLNYKIDWLKRIDSNADVYFNYEYDAELDRALLPVAKVLGLSDVEDIVFVGGATQGVNAVLKSLKPILRAQGRLPSTKRQFIFMMSTTYIQVAGAIRHTCLNDGFEVLELPVIFPMSEAELLSRVAG
ncbi:hypothetical protein BCR33DRAFT_772554 [Rhizoclosmatium globosum]|uniref:Aminotransferase class V domain-containing protein n=1 Tax=Rhizoclosmatium globosum TaxID=329046 RepID=A0A1Y2B3C8_9FUNG|nr:hypothetical protein BCR33DRAFT_772554 [Rhizoclosmatium globosum]|eukprot:ORY29234.1 hypothetical protein BCR33DRAFT_772554 [Rhizoclosmatium globosum]